MPVNKKFPIIRPIRKELGLLVLNEEQQVERWIVHFNKLFNSDTRKLRQEQQNEEDSAEVPDLQIRTKKKPSLN